MKIYYNETIPEIIAFDLDGVLAPRPIIFKEWYDHIVDLVQNRTQKTREETIIYLNSFSINGSNSQQQGSVTNLMIDMGYTRSEWNEYKDKNFKIDKFVKKDLELWKLLKKLNNLYCLTLISNNTGKAVLENLKALGISTEIFKQIISYNYPPGLKQERDKFQFLLSACFGTFSKLIVIGDKFNNDLKPVIENGGSGILIDDYSETKSVIRLLLELKTSL